MVSNKIYWIIWCIFIAYSVFFSPKHNESTKSTYLYTQEMTFGPWKNIDAYVLAVFWFLGKYER